MNALAVLLEQAARRIQALHVGDLYGQAFEEFRARYRHEPGHDLYCQFTSHARDPLERNPYGGQLGHHDPAAVYGYPIAYVLRHPADVWYGTGARYLRVLRDRSRNKLVVTTITENRGQSILSMMDIRDAAGKRLTIPAIEGWWRAARRKHAQRIGRSGNRDARLFFLMAQQVGPHDDSVLSGSQQAARFRHAGYDALEDTAARPSQAVINDREPLQVAFLTRHAFEVVETVELSGKSQTVDTTWNTERFERALAAKIAAAMGDRLAEGPERSNLGGWSYWWTRAGRRIETEVEKDASYFDQRFKGKLGSKPHRAHTIWTPHHVNVRITSEYGLVAVAIDSDERLKALFGDLAARWQAARALEPDAAWRPENRAAWKARADDARMEQARQRLMAREGYKIDEWDARVQPALDRAAGHPVDLTIAQPTHKIGLYDWVERVHDQVAPEDVGAADNVRRVVPDPDTVGRATIKDASDQDPDEQEPPWVRNRLALWAVLAPLYRPLAGQTVARDFLDFLDQAGGPQPAPQDTGTETI